MSIRVEDHVGLARLAAGRFRWAVGQGGIDSDDLVQAAMLGLHRAAQTFDPDRASWSTYGMTWARSSVRRYIYQHRRTVSYPVYRQERSNAETPPRELSLDAPVGGEADGRSWHERHAANATCPEEAAAANERNERLEAALAELPERQARIIRGRLRGLRLVDLGEELGVSRERIRQLEANALDALRARLAS